jgi:hypothetical protein
MKSKIHKTSHAILHVLGYELNINAILTSVAGSITWLLCLWLIHYLGKYSTLPADVEKLKAQFSQFQKEYAPPIHPTPTP